MLSDGRNKSQQCGTNVENGNHALLFIVETLFEDIYNGCSCRFDRRTKAFTFCSENRTLNTNLYWI